jgi:hypothetical protein
MQVYQPFRYVNRTGHIERVAPGEYQSLPDEAVEAAEQAGALKPTVKAHQGAPTNKGRRRRARA